MNRQTGDIGPSDAALVEQAQRGRPGAFAELAARYQDRVYNTCYRLCGNEPDALDLTQTTLLKALEALPRFEARSTFYTWLFRIAVNVAFSQRRQKQRRPTLSLDGPGESDGGLEPAAPAGRDAATGGLEQSELHERVQAALDRLDPEFRAAVVLKDIENLDYAAIAEILDVPVGTVKSRIFRGRTLLRELLSEVRTTSGKRSA